MVARSLRLVSGSNFTQHFAAPVKGIISIQLEIAEAKGLR